MLGMEVKKMTGSVYCTACKRKFSSHGAFVVHILGCKGLK